MKSVAYERRNKSTRGIQLVYIGMTTVTSTNFTNMVLLLLTDSDYSFGIFKIFLNVRLFLLFHTFRRIKMVLYNKMYLLLRQGICNYVGHSVLQNTFKLMF
jgi:hypothetical protein